MDESLMEKTALLQRKIASWTVGEGLAAAEEAGSLRATPEGGWRLSAGENERSHWMHVAGNVQLNCKFLMHVMFLHVYQQRQVPQGCAACFKVKVSPRTLRELVALSEVIRNLPYTAKCGLDAHSNYTQGIYGGYFYLDGIEAARVAYAHIRQAVDEHPRLGQDVPIHIKRGCTEFEIKCGPSDCYEFPPELGEIESALTTYIPPAPPREKPAIQERALIMAQWIETAYRLGDNTYLDFTGGRRWYPATVHYDPAGTDSPPGAMPSGPHSTLENAP